LLTDFISDSLVHAAFRASKWPALCSNSVPEGSTITVQPGSTWDPTRSILRTRFSGPAGIAQVVSWRAGLYAAAAAIPARTVFKLLVDLRGYQVGSMDPSVHKVQRDVIPLFLATYHFRTGFIDFFGVKGEVIPIKEDARCIAVAHVHHEGPKVELYRQTLGRENETFFSQIQEAEAWISATPLGLRPAESSTR
jgi:hypothetical protein